VLDEQLRLSPDLVAAGTDTGYWGAA
jgi:hypothetical protein